MSYKSVERVRSSKWFKITDIIVYGIIIIALAAAITAVVLTRDRSDLSGFYVSCEGERIYEYEFGQDSIGASGKIALVSKSASGFTLKYSNGDAYNLIFVDTDERTVSVVDSNCSLHKDCVYTPKLKYGGSTPIICTPHGLVISPLDTVGNGVIPT